MENDCTMKQYATQLSMRLALPYIVGYDNRMYVSVKISIILI